MAGKRKAARDRSSGQFVKAMENVLVIAKAVGGSITPDSTASPVDPIYSQASAGAGADPSNYITPPFDPSIWAGCSEQSQRLNRCIEIKARNIAGMGWEIVPIEELPAGDQKAFEDEAKLLKSFFRKANPQMPFSTVMELWLTDKEYTGNGYIEVTRSPVTKRPTGVYHVQAVTIRMRKGGKGYIQFRGLQRRYFKEFGDDTIISARTGKPADLDLPINERATEIIHEKVYNPRSVFYGVPRYVACAPAIAGNRLSGLRNVNFFENDASQAMDAKILTPSGWVTMGDMQVGSRTVGVDGRAHTVVGIYPQGMKDIYRVTFSDGKSVECTPGHVWTVSNHYDRQRGITRDMRLHELIEDGFAYRSGPYKWAVPMVDPVEYDEAPPLPIDPYLMGLLLGNGSLSAGTVTLSVNRADADEIDQFLPGALLTGDDFVRRDRCPRSNCSEFRFGRTKASTGKGTRIEQELLKLGLLGKKAGAKFIPEIYLRASVQDRVALLQGLVDTDGHVGDTAVRYTTYSDQLSAGVEDLVGSLGGVATVCPVTGRPSDHQLTICQLPHWICPVRVLRKKAVYHPSAALRVRTMTGATLVRRAEAQCIRTDAADSLYVTDNFVVTHNTPRIIITVSGGRLAGQAVSMIESFFRKEGKGVANAHRALILQGEPKKMSLTSENKVGINVIPLTMGHTEDAGFLRYRAANDDEIREAFGITEPFFSAKTTNRAAAETARQITEHGVFEPERLSLEYRLNMTLVAAFGCEHARLKLKRPESLDPLESTNLDERLARMWALTIDESRVRNGLPPMDPKMNLGEFPFGLLAIMAQMGYLKYPKAGPNDGISMAEDKAKQAKDAQQAQLDAQAKKAASGAATPLAPLAPEAGSAAGAKNGKGTPGPKQGSENQPMKPAKNLPANPQAAEGRPKLKRKEADDTDELISGMGDMLAAAGIEAEFTVVDPEAIAGALEKTDAPDAEETETHEG